MKGWIDAGSDTSWDEYGGHWAKRGRDGAWWFLKFTNLEDAVGEREFAEGGLSRYECAVKRLDMAELSGEQIASALESCGFYREGEKVYSDQGDELLNPDLVIATCCAQYGFGAPMHDEYGDNRPINVRARARREAERLMRDQGAREERLERPVNKIGSTAAEHGRGDINSALFRTPDDPTKALVRKLMFGA